jgi:hypothetical protein
LARNRVAVYALSATTQTEIPDLMMSRCGRLHNKVPKSLQPKRISNPESEDAPGNPNYGTVFIYRFHGAEGFG